MPKPIKFSYEKKAPFRDASFFIIVCEGQNSEPNHFRFFEGISSRVKIISEASKGGGSAPNWLIKNAINKEKEINANPEFDQTWFVIDTDRWKKLIRQLRNECANHQNWNVAESNPCFEVWLYFYVKRVSPQMDYINQCNTWKAFVNSLIKGGFNPDCHPIAIEAAITNAKLNYRPEGDSPAIGCTQLWKLGENLIPFIKKDLDMLKKLIPGPEVNE